MIIQQENRKFHFIEISVFFVFVLLSIAGMLHHEVWLDEAHHWLLARDSTSLPNLIYNARYDGHPILWDMLLFYISGISRNILSMQILHLLIASFAAFLFLRFSPFTIIQKILIIFGYYFLFEYNVICRNYAISWLLMVILCILFTKEKRNYLLITIILFLLANTHLFSLICTIPFFILMLKELINEGKPLKHLIIYTIIYLTGIGIAMATIIPPSDSAFVSLSLSSPVFSKERILGFIFFYMKGIFNLPDFTNYNFWNSNYLVSHLKIVAYPLYILSILLPVLFLRKKTSLFIFYSSTLLIAAALYVMPLSNGAHYKGYCFMMLLVSLWFDKTYEDNSSPLFNFKWKHKEKFAHYVFIFILLMQVFAGVTALYKDYRYPFSEGKETANYLSSNQFAGDEKIILMPMQAGAPIAAYFQRKLYYPEINGFGTFCIWNAKHPATDDDIAMQIKNTLETNPTSNIVLVLAYLPEQIAYIEKQIAATLQLNYKVKSVKRFSESILDSENYTVYQLEHL